MTNKMTERYEPDDDPTSLPIFNRLNQPLGQPPAGQRRPSSNALAGHIEARRTRPEAPTDADRARQNGSIESSVSQDRISQDELSSTDPNPWMFAATDRRLTAFRAPRRPWQPPARGQSDISWELVGRLQKESAELLEDREQSTAVESLDPAAREELGRSIIQQLVESAARDREQTGESAWSLDYQEALAEAVFNAQFRSGRVFDWGLVAQLQKESVELLGRREESQDHRLTQDQREELGRDVIQELLETTAQNRMHDGEPAWSLDYQEALAEAVFNAQFRLGRIQPLVEDDTVEDIICPQADTVFVAKTDGRLVRVPPIADSDEELLKTLENIASLNETDNPRPFSPAYPRLHMRLADGSRLAAAAYVTAHPNFVIRRHRLLRVTLEDLVDRDMLTPSQASFLSAAIRAKKSVVVAGAQGAGKTTLVRALCGEIPPWESIGTFETEFELHLHELRDIHPIVHAWEERPGSGEIGEDGKQAGQFTLDEALFDSFRFSLDRQIVGEVRGREVWAMIKAMESGAGSISTTHAADGDAAFRKLVTCAMEAGPHVTRELATSKLSETIDLIVQVHLQTEHLGGDQWSKRRWVSEILHITPGEQAKGYATTHVFKPNLAGGPAVPGILPDELRYLESYGFDLNSYLAENGTEEETE